MLLRKSLILLAIIMVLILVKCGKRDSGIVARIGDEVVTLKEFEKEFNKANSKPLSDLKATTRDARGDFLQRMIDRRLKVTAAYKAGLDKDEEIIKKVQEKERSLVYYASILKDVMEKMVPESEIREFYDHFNRQIKVRDIFIRRPQPFSQEKQQKIRKRLKEILSKAKKGEDFAKLAKEYSEDKPTAKLGGDLGYLRWGDRDVLRRAAANLKVGEISNPIETSLGYHIIKVEDIRVYFKDNYEEEHPKIVSYLSQKNVTKFEKLFEKYVEDIKKEYSVKYNDDNMMYYVKKLAIPKEKADLQIKDKEPFSSIAERRFAIINDQDRKLVLVSYKGGEITIGDWVDDHINNPSRGYPLYNAPIQVYIDETKKRLDKFVSYRVMVTKGYDNGLDKTPIVQKKLKRYKENLMIRKIEKVEVYDKVNPSEEDLRQYFQDNKDKYKIPETVKVQEIYLKGERLAQKVAARAQGGEDFSALVKQYNERATTKKNDGILGYITENRYGELGRQAFKLKVGEVAGPIPMKGGHYSIIKLLDRKPGGFKTFEEAQPTVESYLKRELVKKREKEWIENLKKNFKVRVNNYALKKAFA